MKHFLLFICTIATLLSCTKYENEVDIQSPNMYEMKSYQLFDSITQKRIIEFTKHIYNSQQSIPEYKLVWKEISRIGEISFNDATIIENDSCEWYYLLPVKKETNLVGIALIPIQDGYVTASREYQINLSLDSRVSKPRLVTSSDIDFHKFDIFCQGSKGALDQINNVRNMTKSGYGEYFGYSHTYSYDSYTQPDGTIVVVAHSGKIHEYLDYYRIVCGLEYTLTQFGGGYFMLYFRYTNYAEDLESLKNHAYEFGGILSHKLQMEGYNITVTPLFSAPGYDHVVGGDDSGGTGGGTGGTGGSDGDNTNPPPTNPNTPCGDTKCPDCKKCLNPTKLNCLKCDCNHNHTVCFICLNCITDQNDLCNTVTKSAAHSNNCNICNCWNVINEYAYSTREEKARAQLEYLRSRGARDYAESIIELLDDLCTAGAKMSDIYPIYDQIETEFLRLKGAYMIAVFTPAIETSILIADILFVNGVSSLSFNIYRAFILRKVGYSISQAAWQGSQGRYFEPLGKGSSAGAATSSRPAIPKNLNEQLIIKEIKANPRIGKTIIEESKMKDPRWLGSEGWQKFSYDNVGIQIHYNVKIVNDVIIAIDDLKFKIN